MKIKNPLYQKIIKELNQRSVEWGKVYLVGGTIRDELIGRENIDLDFCIERNAVRACRFIADAFDGDFYILDEERGAARALIQYKNDLVDVDFTPLMGQTIQEDLKQRDFTINAMAIGLENPDELIDPLNGKEHLQANLLIPCSENSFRNDPVRILRAVRFIDAYNLEYSEELENEIQGNINLLKKTSAERIRDEIFNIFRETKIEQSLHLMQVFSIFSEIFPDLIPLRSIKPGPPHSYNVLNHSIKVAGFIQKIFEIFEGKDLLLDDRFVKLVDKLKPFRPKIEQYLHERINSRRSYKELLILAGLFHDSGKQVVDPSIKGTRKKYPGHAEESTEFLKSWGKKYALSNSEIDYVSTIILHHMKKEFREFADGKDHRAQIFQFFQETGRVGVFAGFLHLGDLVATYEDSLTQERWNIGIDSVTALLDAWFNHYNEIVDPPKIINGHDLMKKYDIEPGVEMGKVLYKIRMLQAGGKIRSKMEAFKYAEDLLRGNK